MEVAIVRTTIDRKTGKLIDQQIIGTEEVDEDRFYRSLVEIFGKRILEAIRNGELVENENEENKVTDKAGIVYLTT